MIAHTGNNTRPDDSPRGTWGNRLWRYGPVVVWVGLIFFASTGKMSASKNAGELIQTLTLNMNRIRQASITREIIEIVSGASAL